MTNRQHVAVMIGLCVNIFVAGTGYGALHQQVKDLDSRISRIEHNEDSQRYQPRAKSSLLGIAEAFADTIKAHPNPFGENYVKRNSERLNVSR